MLQIYRWNDTDLHVAKKPRHIAKLAWWYVYSHWLAQLGTEAYKEQGMKYHNQVHSTRDPCACRHVS